jgi:hypothetical protein
MTSINTNIMNKSKAQIILELVESLNKGNCGTIADRPSYAIEQYTRLVIAGVIQDTENRK